MKSLRDKLAEFFIGEKPPKVMTENSTILEIAAEYPAFSAFVERKYGIRVHVDDNQLSLQEFVTKHGLPSAQIVFMEVQLSERDGRVSEISALEAKEMLKDPKVGLLDVREDCEIKITKIPGSQPLKAALLDEVLSEWPKDKTIILYCHHGVRSLDAAHFLADRGFTRVYSIRGGIDAWSLNVDPTLPRYHGNYC